MTSPAPDSYEARALEWQRHVEQSLRNNKCPDSGDILRRRKLYPDAPEQPNTSDIDAVFSCDLCDCAGYLKEELDEARAPQPTTSPEL